MAHNDCVVAPIHRLMAPQIDTSLIAFRLLVAAAWSDGQLHPAEGLVLGQYLRRLSLPEVEQRKLIAYLSLRPAADASQVWIEQFRDIYPDAQHRREVMDALKLVISADGRVVEPETKLLAELKAALRPDQDTPSLLSGLKAWLGKLTAR